MKQHKDNSKKIQKRQVRFLLLLPLIVLPFLTFFLWSLGIVGKSKAKASAVTGGLNMQLPTAKDKENREWDKLSFYEQADKDSAKYKDAVKNDPFFHRNVDSVSRAASPSNRSSSPFGYNPLPPDNTDANDYKVTQKLAQLNAVIENDKKASSSLKVDRKSEPTPSSLQTKDVDRLERMIGTINQPDTARDPETVQLNGLMDKILDIQHPERVSDKIRQESEQNKKEVFAVTTGGSDGYFSLLESTSENTKQWNRTHNQISKPNAFYSLGNEILEKGKRNAIEAQIEEMQTITSGSVIKLSLQTEIYINGTLIPRGTPLWGIASLVGERLNISLTTIHYQNNLFPVALAVYDLDGLPGIYVPGSLSRDAAKQSGSEAVSSLSISSLDPSLGAQAANAGIATAKALMNKKIRVAKVTIKGGYKVLLKDDNRK